MERGDSIGHYVIERKLGEGGMGVVYLAEHRVLGRRAAVKVLLPEYSKNHDVVARFFNEAKAAAAIDHPGVVQVWDFGEHTDGSAYLVMEFVAGESLATHLARVGRLPPDDAIELATHIASVLHVAHEAGIVHRDLKPDNVLLPSARAPTTPRVKVLDFGIAKLGADVLGQAVKTRTGSLLGTPLYMSPEQCRGASDVDRRADVYALGCILHEMLVGQPPFVKNGLAEVLAAHLYEQVAPITATDPSIPPGLAAAIASALEKDPGRRPPSMQSFAQQLATARSGASHHTTLSSSAAQVLPPSTPSRGRGPLVAILAVVAVGLLVAGGIYAVMGGKNTGDEPRSATPAPLASPTPEATTVSAATIPPPAAPPPADAAPAAPLPAATVTLRITSEPTGAEVYRALDGVLLGTTPFDRAYARTDGAAIFLVRARGHRDETVSLSTAEDGAIRAELRPLRPDRRGMNPRAKPQEPVGDGVADPFGD